MCIHFLAPPIQQPRCFTGRKFESSPSWTLSTAALKFMWKTEKRLHCRLPARVLRSSSSSSLPRRTFRVDVTFYFPIHVKIAAKNLDRLNAPLSYKRSLSCNEGRHKYTHFRSSLRPHILNVKDKGLKIRCQRQYISRCVWRRHLRRQAWQLWSASISKKGNRKTCTDPTQSTS